ncbi:2-dehydro-3-deoxygalactonokinase [Lewinella aquimaris]|uniref:2-dehydro-3-deoxygalactonokinase n=1 Tax=Neolewinella aquimaris TaxID=1835722 RepID=A0A840DXT0_9BACT|nr:2-dehydro-3-deoxygalactonokinase [Neolewinella aquimaris]MBB4078014.1 2-dehydro-3-deoxygalactonokinase [Neolewinella aquimaris]
MTDHPYFISCDWGTSNFRLRVVEAATLDVLAQRATGQGIQRMNEQFLSGDRSDRYRHFAAYLREQVDLLPEARPTFPIVVSGMASANIGMQELPYGKLPIGRQARNLVSEVREFRSGQALVLVSGVHSETGIMRGEETQALGLLDELDPQAEGVLLLPGTHSKHLRYRQGRFTDFQSYMTGELFEFLTSRSILANSVRDGVWNTRTQSAFLSAVQTGCREGATAHLFAIRAGHVLRDTDPVDNYYRLSGLLIGAELHDVAVEVEQPLWLAASGSLRILYRAALQELCGADHLVVLDDQLIERALLRGQCQILATHG